MSAAGMTMEQLPTKALDNIFSYLSREDLLECRLLGSKLKLSVEKALADCPEKRKRYIILRSMKKEKRGYVCEMEKENGSKDVFKIAQVPTIFKIHNIHITKLDLHLYAGTMENTELVRMVVRKYGFSVDKCIVTCHTNCPDWIRRVPFRPMVTNFAEWSIWNELDPDDENRVQIHTFITRCLIRTNFSHNPKYEYPMGLIWQACCNRRFALGLHLDANGKRPKLKHASEIDWKNQKRRPITIRIL